jgi:hypothetical protein
MKFFSSLKVHFEIKKKLNPKLKRPTRAQLPKTLGAPGLSQFPAAAAPVCFSLPYSLSSPCSPSRAHRRTGSRREPMARASRTALRARAQADPEA